MKKLLFIAFLVLINLPTFGQFDIKAINESLTKINDSLYASKYEVSNKLYMSFLNYLKNSNNAQLLITAQIDSLKWKDPLSCNEPYVQFYHLHPAYQNYPVVNINYEAAKLFCEWLTEQSNTDKKRKFKKVVFKLPSEKEWIIAAQAGNHEAIYPWKGNKLYNNSNKLRCNFKRQTSDTSALEAKKIENKDVLAPINSYWKNNFGIYNMSGNVAEMINEKGILKGGSWKDNSEYLKIDTKYFYDGNAQTFVGFRYFVAVLEK